MGLIEGKITGDVTSSKRDVDRNCPLAAARHVACGLFPTALSAGTLEGT
jgi:hypothetical protein